MQSLIGSEYIEIFISSSVKREINISLALFSLSLSFSLSYKREKREMRKDSIRFSNGIYYARQAELMHSGADTMIASAGQCDFSLWTGRYSAFRFRCSMSTTSDGCVLTLFTASGRPVFDDRSRLMHYMIHAEFIRACTSIASVERVDDSRSSVICRIENREGRFFSIVRSVNNLERGKFNIDCNKYF